MYKLEEEYNKYLEMVGLSLDRMNPIQKIETKRAFYGGYGMMLLMYKLELGGLPESKAIEELTSIQNQINEFWISEDNKAGRVTSSINVNS